MESVDCLVRLSWLKQPDTPESATAWMPWALVAELKLGAVSAGITVGAGRGGGFRFCPGMDSGVRYRLAHSGELLRRVVQYNVFYVCLEPRHVVECLGADVAGQFVVSSLADAEDDPDFDAAYLEVLDLLGVERAVRLAVATPSLARRLSAEAAAVYASENPELSRLGFLL